MKELVHDGRRPIGWLIRGSDGAWWLTLQGAVPTTLGPDRDRAGLISRGIRRWMRFNPEPRPDPS
jgi:hypothetical protein